MRVVAPALWMIFFPRKMHRTERYRGWDFSSTQARLMDFHAQHSSAKKLTFNMGNRPLLRMEQSWASSGVQAAVQFFFVKQEVFRRHVHSGV